jgi:predicted negative regulator of RcsB-dependent stress response
MESDITESALLYKLWAWGDKNRKQLLWGLVAVIIVGLGVAFWLAHSSQEQNDANDALSKLMNHAASPTAPEASPEALLKLSSDYPGTDAGQRALLIAAGDFFADGKYDQAQAQFQKFQQQYSGSPLVPQAALGVAACYDAQGKTNDAVSAYQGVADRYPNDNVSSQAKLDLARLLEAQGKFKEARSNLEDVTHGFPGTISQEANELLRELNAAHPELQPTNSAPMGRPAFSGATPGPAVTAPKTSAAPVINLKKP